jgi:hypothetical protein
MRLGTITLGGRREILVGGKRYGVPRTARVAHSTLNGSKVAYVLDSGRLHVLVAGGEVLDVPEHLARLITKKIFGAA